MSVVSSAISGGKVTIAGSTTPKIYNLSMPLANTEYSQALSPDILKLTIKLRDMANLRIAFNSGETLTNYITIPGGCSFTESDLKLYKCEHYVPSGSICYISSFQCANTGTVVGTSSAFSIRRKNIPSDTTAELDISDILYIKGSTNPFERKYESPIEIVRPARLTMYVTPASGTTTTQYAAISFYEV